MTGLSLDSLEKTMKLLPAARAWTAAKVSLQAYEFLKHEFSIKTGIMHSFELDSICGLHLIPDPELKNYEYKFGNIVKGEFIESKL